MYFFKKMFILGFLNATFNFFGYLNLCVFCKSDEFLWLWDASVCKRILMLLWTNGKQSVSVSFTAIFLPFSYDFRKPSIPFAVTSLGKRKGMGL